MAKPSQNKQKLIFFITRKLFQIFLNASILIIGACFILIIVLSILFFNNISNFFFSGAESPRGEFFKVIVQVIGGSAVLWGVFVANKRVKTMQENNLLSEKGNTAERFKNAIEHLGSKKSTIVLGGIHALHQIAKENKEYTEQILNILCSYIRNYTSKEIKWTQLTFEEKKNARPSIVVQNILDILFRKYDSKIYRKYPANLRHAKLYGANLNNAYLRNVNFEYSELNGAFLNHADFSFNEIRKSCFDSANLSSSVFTGARVDDSSFNQAFMIGIKFEGALIRDTSFIFSALSESHFELTRCSRCDFSGSQLSNSHFEGAFISLSKFNAVAASFSKFQACSIINSKFYGSNLSHSLFEGTYIYANDYYGTDFSNCILTGMSHVSKPQFEILDNYGKKFDGTHSNWMRLTPEHVKFIIWSLSKNNIEDFNLQNIKSYLNNYKNVKCNLKGVKINEILTIEKVNEIYEKIIRLRNYIEEMKFRE